MILAVRRVHRRARWAFLISGLSATALLLSGALPRERTPRSPRTLTDFTPFRARPVARSLVWLLRRMAPSTS
jgi:hypothetical protein